MSESMNELNLTKNISLLHSPTFVHKIRTILTLDYGQCPMDSYEKRESFSNQLELFNFNKFFRNKLRRTSHNILFYLIKQLVLIYIIENLNYHDDLI